MNSVESLIKARRTVHEYDAGPIDENILHTAIELAAYAPNHKLTRPWRFFRTGPEVRMKLAHITAKLKAEKTGQVATPEVIAALEKKFMTPSELIVLGHIRSEDSLREREDFAAVACAVQNMSLYLWSEGIGSKWGTGGPVRAFETYKILKIDRQKIELDGFFWIGRMPGVPPIPPKATVKEILTHVL